MTIILLSLASVAYSLITNSNGVSYLIQNSSVACYSGFVEDLLPSPTCDNVTQCTSAYALTSIDPTMTQLPPALLGGSTVGADTLALTVQQGAVLGRQLTSIVLNSSEVLCNYPGLYWWHGVDFVGETCVDVYVSNIPWSIASSICNMTRSSNATTVSYAGAATISYADQLPPIDGIAQGTRQLASVIRYEVEQPTSISNIQSQVNVFNNPYLLSAVTAQKYNFATGNATLTLVLSLAAPLRVVDLAIAAPPGAVLLAQSGNIDDVHCANNATLVCQQAITFALQPTACSLNGTYAFSFDVGCQPIVNGTAQCPLQSSTEALNITVTLSSEDLCVVSSQELQVNGTLASYASFDLPSFSFGPPQTAFFQAQPEHFELTITSVNGFPFASSAVSQVLLDNALGSQVTIFDKSTKPTPDVGWAWHLDANASSGFLVHRHHFVYTPDPTPFGGNVTRNQPVTSNVVAAVDITFVNGGRRRALMPLVRRQTTINTITGAMVGSLVITADPVTGAPIVSAKYTNQVQIAATPATTTAAGNSQTSANSNNNPVSTSSPPRTTTAKFTLTGGAAAPRVLSATFLISILAFFA